MTGKMIALFAALCLGAGLCGCSYEGQVSVEPAQGRAGRERIVSVARVVDGDTIKLTTGERVRYIGVDTPELARDGRDAEDFAKQAVQCNRGLLGRGPVKLVFDKEMHDRHGRVLAYVFAGDDYQTFVNEELVRRGCAETMFIAPNTKYARPFRELERQARDAGRGLWGE